jgi:hypothetical protein
MKKSVYLENVERSIQRNIRLSNFETDLETREFLVKIMEFCEKLFDKSLDREEK